MIDCFEQNQPSAENTSNLKKKNDSQTNEKVNDLRKKISETSNSNSIQNEPPNGNGFRKLKALDNVKAVTVEQALDLVEILTRWEMNNAYTIKDDQNRLLFYATESTNSCFRQLWGSNRKCRISLIDPNTQETVALFDRRGICYCVCFALCYEKLTARISMDDKPNISEDESLLGYVNEMFWICSPSFEVLDQRDDSLYRLQGPCCPQMNFSCCAEISFDIIPTDSTKTAVGKIGKQFSGVLQEMTSDADNFSLVFPDGSSAGTKAVLIGAALLLDMIFYEECENCWPKLFCNLMPWMR